MTSPRTDLPQGTLDLLILQVLALEPLYGYAIAQRLQQISRDVVQVQQGSLYPALHRLENRGLLTAVWRLSDTGRSRRSTASPGRGGPTRDGNRELAPVNPGREPYSPDREGELMTWWQRLRRRNELEQQLDAELRDHLERQVTDYVQAGMSEEDARRRARLAFGGLDQVKEQCRDVRGTRWLEEFFQDIRYGARPAGQAPRLHDRRGPVARAGHRGDLDDLQRAQRSGAAPAPVPTA